MRPTVRTYQLDGTTWHYVCACYPTDRMGADAYQRLLRKTPRGELGIYRHGVPGEGGTNVSLVSLNRREIERAARHLAAGADFELPALLVEGMIRRRAQVVVAAANTDQPTGRIKIRHGRGALLDPSGHMHEQGGQG